MLTPIDFSESNVFWRLSQYKVSFKDIYYQIFVFFVLAFNVMTFKQITEDLYEAVVFVRLGGGRTRDILCSTNIIEEANLTKHDATVNSLWN